MFDPRFIIIAMMIGSIFIIILVFGMKYLKEDELEISKIKKIVLFCPIKKETEILMNVSPEDVLSRLTCNDCDKKEECSQKNISRIIEEQTS